MSDILIPDDDGAWGTAEAMSAREKADKGAKLRERICMALIASPAVHDDVVMRAKDIEAYINGMVTMPATGEQQPKEKLPMTLNDAVIAATEIFNSVPGIKATQLAYLPMGMKSKEDPFGLLGSYTISFEPKP